MLPFACQQSPRHQAVRQGLRQIPFGLLSDRIGRKAMIVLGLILFGIGSGVAAASTSIDGVLLGRVLQGAGAVGAVILAAKTFRVFLLMYGKAPGFREIVRLIKEA